MTTKPEWCPEGWERGSFSHGDDSHAFYVIDRGGTDAALPSVMLMHEFPGISEHLVELADVLSGGLQSRGSVDHRPDGAPDCARLHPAACVRREIHAIAGDRVSTSAAWPRVR